MRPASGPAEKRDGGNQDDAERGRGRGDEVRSFDVDHRLNPLGAALMGPIEAYGSFSQN